MSVRIENLHPGDYVTVTEDLRPIPEYCRMYDHWSGIPYVVLSVCPPFVALQDTTGKVHGLDLRAFGLSKLSEEYVRAMLPAEPGVITLARFPGQKRRKRRTKSEPPDPRNCPRCGERMVQRIPNESIERVWHRVCPGCGFDAGPAEACP